MAKDGYLEAACFAAGCDLRCPQCQNWGFSFLGLGDPLTPKEAASIMTATGRRYNVNRLAISGGECTLNRRWLLQYLGHLRDLSPGARLHVDTNGTILTEDYLDELVLAGMSDIGIPYNRALVSIDEIMEIGREVADIDPWVQVCVLDYRPEYQRLDIVSPGFSEMMEAHDALRETGLETVICQTSKGRIGPSGDILP